MIGRRHEIAWLQSGFYRDSYHRILLGLFISVSVMVVLICAILYYVVVNPPARYYATTTDGKIIQMKLK